MGVYKITNRTHSGRPVWQSTVREDRYLFYNGDRKIYLTCLSLSEYIIFQGRTSRWIIYKQVDGNTGAYIKSQKKGLVYLPVRGWQYSGGGWQDDDTLTITGKDIN